MQLHCLPGERIGGSKQWLQAINMAPGWNKKACSIPGYAHQSKHIQMPLKTKNENIKALGKVAILQHLAFGSTISRPDRPDEGEVVPGLVGLGIICCLRRELRPSTVTRMGSKASPRPQGTFVGRWGNCLF